MEGLKHSVETVINDFQPTVLAGYHLTAIKGTKLYQLVEGTKDGKWIKIDDESQVTEAYSYTQEEFKDMARYSVILTSLYNVLKRMFPGKIVRYDNLVKFTRKHIDETIDMKKIEQFDTQYAERYWMTRLKELKNEEANNSETWRVSRKSEKDYTR